MPPGRDSDFLQTGIPPNSKRTFRTFPQNKTEQTDFFLAKTEATSPHKNIPRQILLSRPNLLSESDANSPTRK